MNKVVVFAKKNWKYIVTAIVALIIGAAIGPSNADLDAANKEVEIAQNELKEASYTKNNLASEKKSLQTETDNLQVKVDEAAPWFKMTDEQKKQAEADVKAAEEKRLAEEKAAEEKRLAEEKAKKEAEEKAKAEAEAKKIQEKKDSAQSIEYAQLKKSADRYAGEYVKYTGKILEIQEGDGLTMMRLAVTKKSYGYSPNDVILITYAGYTDFVEDNIVTVYGVLAGNYSYTSQAGWKITIPSMIADTVE